jgi:hypothetical protein
MRQSRWVPFLFPPLVLVLLLTYALVPSHVEERESLAIVEATRVVPCEMSVALISREPVETTEAAVSECLEDASLFLIHLPISSTSRNLQRKIRRFEELPLFTFSLPSLIETVEPDRFRYAVAIAADAGDPWYDVPVLRPAMQAWWQERWTKKWRTRCAPPFTFYVYANTRSRNTWAVNYATQRGYEEGADYFYRINDDTVLHRNQWSSAFVAELAAMRPIPNLGVTGPADPYLKNEWLTHSFISRRHLEWYGTHFPFLLGNWWTDNWIQLVYSPPYPNATFGPDARLMSIVANVSVKHMVLKARYEIKATPELFQKQLAIDRIELETFVKKRLKP